MANDSRQERLLMRQRGAGSRQINSIDFGFAFTTPSQLRRSRTRSRTPQTASRSVRQSTKTPKASDRSYLREASPNVRSSRSVRLLNSTLYHEGVASSEQPAPKRRRLSEISNMTSVASIDQRHNLGKLGLIGEAVEDGLDERPRSDIYEDGEAFEVTTRSILEQNDEDKENDTSSLSFNKSVHKRRKRKSIGQQRSKRKRESLKQLAHDVRNGTSSEALTIEDSTEHSARIDEATDVVNSSANDINARPENITPIDSDPPPTTQPQELEVSTEALPVPKRQKKRKSILFTKRKRRSTDTKPQISIPVDEAFSTTYQSKIPSSRNRGGETGSDSGFEDDQQQSEEGTNNKHKSLRDTQTNRLLKEQIQHDPDNSDDSDQEYHPEEASPNPTPAPNRNKAVSKERQRKPSNDLRRIDNVQQPKSRTKSAVPVLTHRIANSKYLPTIQEVSETEEADYNDDLAIHPNFTTRETPNAIDVLAQICRETIDSAIQTLQKQSQAGNIPKAQLKQNAIALDEFRTQLESRLFDVSQSLDQRLQLEARLRKSKREKALVQSEWLDIRKRRDQIALRIDAVRRQHWKNEVIGKRAWEASEAARALEVEVHKSEDGDLDEETDISQRLEIKLRNLVGDVSSFNGQGVLQKLKSFNTQLEKFTGLCETS